MRCRSTVAALAVGLATFSSLQASSAEPEIVSVSHGQCRARWSAGFGALRLHDADPEDHDYCYVVYGDDREQLGNRAIVEQDEPAPVWIDLSKSWFLGDTVFWRVCKERQNDPDICSDVQADDW